MKRKLLAGILVTAFAVIVTPVANAGPVLIPSVLIKEASFSTVQVGSHTATGGCFFEAHRFDLLTSTQFQGKLGDVSVTENAGTPMAGSVTCKILINGSTLAAGPFQFGDNTESVQTGVPHDVSFSSDPVDRVTLCEAVHWVDGTDSGFVCQRATEVTAQQPIVDLVGAVSGVVDPIVCPVFASLAGSYPSSAPPGIVIKPDGDVYIDLLDENLVYDCPPY